MVGLDNSSPREDSQLKSVGLVWGSRCAVLRSSDKPDALSQLASCLIYARGLLEYINLIVCVRSVNKMLPSKKFAEYKVITFLILREKC